MSTTLLLVFSLFLLLTGFITPAEASVITCECTCSNSNARVLYSTFGLQSCRVSTCSFYINCSGIISVSMTSGSIVRLVFVGIGILILILLLIGLLIYFIRRRKASKFHYGPSTSNNNIPAPIVVPPPQNFEMQPQSYSQAPPPFNQSKSEDLEQPYGVMDYNISGNPDTKDPSRLDANTISNSSAQYSPSSSSGFANQAPPYNEYVTRTSGEYYQRS